MNHISGQVRTDCRTFLDMDIPNLLSSVHQSQDGLGYLSGSVCSCVCICSVNTDMVYKSHGNNPACACTCACMCGESRRLLFSLVARKRERNTVV